MKTLSYGMFTGELIAVTGMAKKYQIKINDLPDYEKPREKLAALGPANLTVSELLSLVLSTGTKKEDVLSMGRRVVADYGTRALTHQKDAAKLSSDLGIPIVKSMQIIACAELGRRFFDKAAGAGTAIRTPEDVFEYAKDMRELPKEHLRGLYLNTHHRVIHDEVISIGTINANIIHPREVFRPALQYAAAAVVLVHNHPSGEVSPSQSDIEVTRQLVEAGKTLGIELLDHVVVTKDSFMSVPVSY
jgi:DNA repair protein RadC